MKKRVCLRIFLCTIQHDVWEKSIFQETLSKVGSNASNFLQTSFSKASLHTLNLLPNKTKFKLPNGFLAVNVSDSVGSLRPTWFAAKTRRTYWVLSTRPETASSGVVDSPTYQTLSNPKYPNSFTLLSVDQRVLKVSATPSSTLQAERQ